MVGSNFEVQTELLNKQVFSQQNGDFLSSTFNGVPLTYRQLHLPKLPLTEARISSLNTRKELVTTQPETETTFYV